MEDTSKVIVQDQIPIDRTEDRWHRVLWKGLYRRLLRLGPDLNLNVEELRSWRGRVPPWLAEVKEERFVQETTDVGGLEQEGNPSAADSGGSQQVEDECGMWADDDYDKTTEESGPDYGPPSTSGKLSLMS